MLNTASTDKRHLRDLLYLSVVRTTRNVYQITFKCYLVSSNDVMVTDK